MEIWKGLAFVGFVMLAAASFMPWITWSASIIGSSYGVSYSMVDLWKDMTAHRSLSQSLSEFLTTMMGSWGVFPNLRIDPELQSRLWMATGFAAVFYIFALVCIALFFPWRAAFAPLSSGVLAIGSFVSAFFATDFLKQQAVEWESSAAQFLNMRLDIGAWFTLFAGFILVGSYALGRLGVTLEPVQPPEAVEAEPVTVKPKLEPTMMFCKECGSAIPRDSKFCKECGAKLV